MKIFYIYEINSLCMILNEKILYSYIKVKSNMFTSNNWQSHKETVTLLSEATEGL